MPVYNYLKTRSNLIIRAKNAKERASTPPNYHERRLNPILTYSDHYFTAQLNPC